MDARPALLACALLLLQPFAAAEGPPPLELQPCELRGSHGVGRVQAECGTLAVAENPDASDGRTIDLFVARIPALDPEPAADAFTVINGGPGAASIDLYLDLQGAFAPVRLERDIVIVDQRGTGRSAPLHCDATEEPLAEFDEDAVRDATTQCIQRGGRKPQLYFTGFFYKFLTDLTIFTVFKANRLNNVQKFNILRMHIFALFGIAFKSKP